MVVREEEQRGLQPAAGWASQWVALPVAPPLSRPRAALRDHNNTLTYQAIGLAGCALHSYDCRPCPLEIKEGLIHLGLPLPTLHLVGTLPFRNNLCGYHRSFDFNCYRHCLSGTATARFYFSSSLIHNFLPLGPIIFHSTKNYP